MDFREEMIKKIQSLPASAVLSSPEHWSPEKNVFWVKVLNLSEINLVLGLSADGCWIREGIGDVCEVDPMHGLVPLYPCLEMNFIEFREKLMEGLISSGLSSNFINHFPTDDLVVQAVRSSSEYWVKKGLFWLEEIPITSKIEMALDEVVQLNDKRLSQPIRQKIKRLLINSRKLKKQESESNGTYLAPST